MTMVLGRYPEYTYPFSYVGELEGRLDEFVAEGRSCDVSDILRLIYPSVQLGSSGKEVNPLYFREYYPRPGMPNFFRTHWAGEEAAAFNGYPSSKAPGVNVGDHISLRYGEPLLRGGTPTWNEPQEYHCPYGWRRFSFAVPDFHRFDTYAVAYHGTSFENIPEILRTSLQPGEAQEGGDGECVYLSPSIEYAACPRYAKTVHVDDRFVQAVIQFRVKQPFSKQGETLGPTFHPHCPGGWASRPWGEQVGGLGQPYPKKHLVFDPHYKNEELEWLYSAGAQDLREAVVPTGLMIRVLTSNPSDILRRRQERES